MSIPLTGAGRTALDEDSEATYGAAYLGLPYHVSGGSYAFLGLPNVELTYLTDEEGDPKAAETSLLVQYDEYVYASVSSISTVVPVDGSFDSSDGTQIFSETITPVNANSNLAVRLQITCTAGGTGVALNPRRVIAGVFVDSETSPRYVVPSKWLTKEWPVCIACTLNLGTFKNMDSKTVKVRIGMESGGHPVLLNRHDRYAASGNWISPELTDQVTMTLAELIL